MLDYISKRLLDNSGVSRLLNLVGQKWRAKIFGLISIHDGRGN